MPSTAQRIVIARAAYGNCFLREPCERTKCQRAHIFLLAFSSTPTYLSGMWLSKQHLADRVVETKANSMLS